MDNNHVFKYISEQELGGMLNAFHAITRLNISLIDENGIIVKAFGKVKAADNPAQMLKELE